MSRRINSLSLTMWLWHLTAVSWTSACHVFGGRGLTHVMLSAKPCLTPPHCHSGMLHFPTGKNWCTSAPFPRPVLLRVWVSLRVNFIPLPNTILTGGCWKPTLLFWLTVPFLIWHGRLHLSSIAEWKGGYKDSYLLSRCFCWKSHPGAVSSPYPDKNWRRTGSSWAWTATVQHLRAPLFSRREGLAGVTVTGYLVGFLNADFIVKGRKSSFPSSLVMWISERCFALSWQHPATPVEPGEGFSATTLLTR